MDRTRLDMNSRSKRLIALIAFQTLCAAYFLFDVVKDVIEADATWLHGGAEIAATLGLIVGIWFEVRVLRDLLRQQEQLRQGLGVAAGELAAIMDAYFRSWNLTAAEQDVATFTIKGYSIGEIASLRGSAEGTIKTHLHSIYRKANVPGRAQLVSILIEDLLRAPLIDPPQDGGALATGPAMLDETHDIEARILGTSPPQSRSL